MKRGRVRAPAGTRGEPRRPTGPRRARRQPRPTSSAHYSFRQSFPYSADRSFVWCIDFQPGDLGLEGVDGQRRVRWLSEDTVLLTDRFPRPGARAIAKTKLVRVRREDRAWTSTHLTGPNRHSQFWYRIVPDGPHASHLEFTALHIEPTGPSLPPSADRHLVERLAREDAEAWRLLADAMRADLG